MILSNDSYPLVSMGHVLKYLLRRLGSSSVGVLVHCGSVRLAKKVVAGYSVVPGAPGGFGRLLPV